MARRTVNPLPAEVFSPGEYLQDDLDARGWTAAEFAELIGRPAQTVSEIVNGRRAITAETAMQIGAALGTTAEMWLAMQGAYDVFQARRKGTTADSAAVLGRVRHLVPLAELRRLGWIKAPNADLDQLTVEVCALLGVATLEEEPSFALAARRSNEDEPLTPAQRAWAARVLQIAGSLEVLTYRKPGLRDFAEALPQRLSSPAALRTVPSELAALGVRMVLLPHLTGSKIDGAAFEDGKGPIVALSLRGDRFDGAVFTLMHELAHVVAGHVGTKRGPRIDEGSEASSEPMELEANELASRWMFPGGCSMVGRPSRPKVEQYAATLGLHPALVVGRLRFDGRLDYRSLGDLIPKVRQEFGL